MFLFDHFTKDITNNKNTDITKICLNTPLDTYKSEMNKSMIVLVQSKIMSYEIMSIRTTFHRFVI